MLSTMIIFFKTSERTVRGLAGYAGKFISMVSIFLHDCKEPDMVGLLDGNSHGVVEVALKSNARRSYCLISMWSNDTPIAH